MKINLKILRNQGITAETWTENARAQKEHILFTLLDEMLYIVHTNQNLFRKKGATPSFKRVLRGKLETFQKDGYYAAAIWKYKLRHLLDV